MKVRSKICCLLYWKMLPGSSLQTSRSPIFKERKDKTKGSDPEQLNRLDESTPETKWKVFYGSYLMLKPWLECCLSNLKLMNDLA